MATKKSKSAASDETSKLPAKEYEGNNIERLFEAGKLDAALEKFGEFLALSSEQVEVNALLRAQITGLETEVKAQRIGAEAMIIRNKISLGFQSQLADFRKKVLAEYFDLRGQMEFLNSITDRDEVIHRILDLRLAPKHYQRDERWGKVEGNSSIIYRLFNPDTRRHAIALVLKIPNISPELLQEIELLADIRHRNIIKMLDYEMDRFPFFAITEFVYGENLPNALAVAGPRSISQTADWMYQLTDALDYLRHKRILHANVRPTKIYVDDEWQIMISPFDLIKTSSSLKSARSSNERTFSRYLDLCQYGSPELLARDGENLSLAEMCIADLYSLGLVGYKMLTGRDLFSGKYLFEILENRKKFETDPAERAAKLEKLPAGELAEVIEKLLEFDPKKRSQYHRNLHSLLRSLTPMTRHNFGEVSPTKQSYRRCLAGNREFIRDFYKAFFEKESSSGKPFSEFFPDEISQKRQAVMLQMTVDLLLDMDSRGEYFEKLVNPSNAAHRHFSIADFQIFIDTLIETIRLNDSEHWTDLLEKDWQEVRNQALSSIEKIRRLS